MIKFEKPHLGIFIFIFLISLFVRCSYGVPIKFPECSHIPQDDPYGSLWLYPIWFAQSSTPMYINWKGGCYREALQSTLLIPRGKQI
jgi:hypothetical protein